VLSHITDELGPELNIAGVGREYSPTGFGEGLPLTFQAIFLETDAWSPWVPSPNTSTAYQRGLQRQMAFGSGDAVRVFDDVSFRDLMDSLIGDSNFRFTDSFILTESFPDQNSSATTYVFGYAGPATLVSVSVVPEPSGFVLVLMSAFGFVLCHLSHCLFTSNASVRFPKGLTAGPSTDDK
jgi:hypothetical protein